MVFELLFGATVAKALVSEKNHEKDELHDRILLDGINAVPIEDVATVVGVSRRHIVLNEYTTTDCQRMMDYAKEHFGTKAYKKFKERETSVCSQNASKRIFYIFIL